MVTYQENTYSFCDITGLYFGVCQVFLYYIAKIALKLILTHLRKDSKIPLVYFLELFHIFFRSGV